jgi:hypothetical protein
VVCDSLLAENEKLEVVLLSANGDVQKMNLFVVLVFDSEL